jgi:branched-subunit amino acid transport protein
MMLVTYLPRMAPLVALDAERLPPRAVRMLKNIPYAVLGALIFPGILQVGDHLLYGIAGGIAAALAALAGLHLVLVVLSGVAAVTLLVQLL